MARRYVIIGGGMMGLTLAWRLLGRGHVVTVLEASPALGGLASVWSLGDLRWDRHYHVTLFSDFALRSLLTELGIESRIRWTVTKTSIFSRGSLHPMSSAVDYLRYPELTLSDKLRVAATMLRGASIADVSGYQNVPVGDWLTKWSGERAFEVLWRPLLESKLGSAWTDTSAAFILTVIARLYAARRAGLKRDLFGSLPGGYGELLDALSSRLLEAGAVLRTSCAVSRIVSTPAGQSVRLTSGEELAGDRVVLTTTTGMAAGLCPQLSPEEKSMLEAVRYVGIVCPSALLSRPATGSYLVYLTDPSFPFTGIIEGSTLVEPCVFGGRTLLYLPKYCMPGDPLFEKSDAEIRRDFLAGLRRILPDLAESDVEAFQVSRVRQVFALPALGFDATALPRKTSVPGVYLVCSGQIQSGTLNVNETVRLADSALPELAA